ncbi:hypothetical protein [Flavobacterium sp. RS13.1]|uniref:hypothetical protein n=1 Tax=Flavobacterium sp. RS13.1 TaxID=3400345 RepID=UPI003AAE31FC
MFKFFRENFRNLSFLQLVLTSVILQGQVNEKSSDIEKSYLHTDRSCYFIGEDLWYKAYNVNASSNILYDNSNILYVELISSDFKIVARNKTNLEIGLGNGDFKLVDSLGIKPGRYQIRAYTNWNRNFGEDFVFKKDIEIFDVFETNSSHHVLKDKNEISKDLTTDFQNTIKVDFFPEGGSFLENVTSVVGIKAVDSKGNPIDVKGEVFDSDNEMITSFESSHDGMGKFQMIPITGKHYYAKIKTLNGTEVRAELPKVFKEGYLLSFRVFRGKNIISITTNPETLAKKNVALTVVCKARGNSYLETTQTLIETTLSFELPKDKTPDGISQITLFDNDGKPQSERLVYIEKEHDLEVTLITDKESYKPEEKTTISVTSKSKTGEAKSASFSVSVTDMNGVLNDNDFGTNICSNFLIESDIRGEVYNPGYYFNFNNAKRLEHLDNLLLTQGWRDFLWKTIPKQNSNISYKAEKGITISGRVKQLLGKKTLVDSNMALALMSKKKQSIFNTTTDSIGRFQFENLLFSGKTIMLLSTRDKEGKFKGEIVLDSIEQAPVPVSLKKKTIGLESTTNPLVENVYKKFTAFGVKPENVLKEVTISAKNKNKYQYATYYGIPDYSYVADKDALRFTNIIYLIEEKMPPSRFLRSHRTEEEESGSPLILLDGLPVLEYNELYMISPSDVLRIEAIKGGVATMAYGEEARDGIISIITNGNKGNQPKKGSSSQSIKKEIEGFYTARVFYQSNPEKPNLDLDVKNAVRNTVYWNPYVHPDKTGNVNVSYYNIKAQTKLKVALEGITATGIPVVKNTYYVIKE